ncbi:class I adenylate-forming enzyme family protein [uncultured Methylobacterium sp.]|mgnify:CR=1 FL=1|jgi:acyl-CoA synthetase (AMP-forming)/AMP-acid ligase II|uniref:class I adenylate-forming enzyme family protein n=1 Tax=uncultured Methylobacterium sp. TaxID=157278 RepID=UPI002639F782|nr:class I adenylate-forming enzyme family protein [uncultured Methylobacterium sp.]
MTDPSSLLSLTVPQLLRRRAREGRTGLALSAQAAGGWRDRLTYGQLVQRMDAVAAGFHALGLRTGDRIGVLLGNEAGRECLLTALGALRIGAAVVPFNTRAADEELGHALALAEPAAIACTAAGASRLARLAPAVRPLVVGPPAAGEGAPAGAEPWQTPWPEPLAGEFAAAPPEDPDPDRLGCLLFTSGTTARSKAVMHSHATMLGAGLACGEALGLRADDLYQGGWPFFTSSPLNLGAMSCWIAGAGLVLEEPLDNRGRLRLIASERTTFYHGVPSVVHFLMEEFAARPTDVSSLRRVGYGGSAMPPDVIRRLAAHWPQVEQVQIYGMTESGPSGTRLEPALMEDKLGSIGSAMPHCAVTIVDEAGAPLGPGETGEILLHGPGVARGYFRNPAATAEAFVQGGIRTGDVGHLDADGFLYFTDRRKDVINRGGLKVASVAVEEVLYRHPDVREAAVIAVPHPGLGEDVAACVVPREPGRLDTAALAAFCAERLADYARPRRWLVLDELPKNPMGKVLKTALRARFAPVGDEGTATPGEALLPPSPPRAGP